MPVRASTAPSPRSAPAARSVPTPGATPWQNPSSPRPPAAKRSPSAAASSMCPTTRSFPSSKATAPARTSGAPRVRVLDAAVAKAYGGAKKIHWLEVFAGEKANNNYGTWLPDATVQACRDYLVGIKGPLTTPVGGGIRSLNVALRQMLDLYVCLRPVRWFEGVPSPVKTPGRRGHGDLPREHRGHLRRHRMGRRQRRVAEGAGLHRRRNSRSRSARSASARRKRSTTGRRRWKASARRTAR